MLQCDKLIHFGQLALGSQKTFESRNYYGRRESVVESSGGDGRIGKEMCSRHDAAWHGGIVVRIDKRLTVEDTTHHHHHHHHHGDILYIAIYPSLSAALSLIPIPQYVNCLYYYQRSCSLPTDMHCLDVHERLDAW